MTEDVTVLIANIGRLDNLLPCLQSLFGALGDVSHRVIVGFNFQGDSNSPRALAGAFPQVEQLRAPMKLGYCRAYNQLMAHGSGRYALILDDDTILRPGSVETMVRFMDAHPDVGIAGCRTVNPDGSYQKTTALAFDFRTESLAVFWPDSYWRDDINETVTEWRSAQWLNAHFLLVRAEVLEQVGVFDEFFYTSVFEADWCLRARNAGWKVAYVPQAEVMHIGGPHSVQLGVKSYKNIVQMYVNRYYFFRKHYGDAAVLALRPLVTTGALLRVLNYLAVWFLSNKRRREAEVKISAYLRIMLLGLARRPDALPDALRREYEAFGAVLQPSLVR